MKTLIVYASKYGCTAECAAYLQSKLTGGITIHDINKTPGPVKPDGFDTIIIGGSVYISKISKNLRVFCENNLDVLLQKRVGLFLCCALTEQADEFFAGNFPAKLLQSAVVKGTFGSEARLEGMKFLDKMIIKAVTKGDFSKFKISYDSMDEFVRGIMQGGS